MTDLHAVFAATVQAEQPVYLSLKVSASAAQTQLVEQLVDGAWKLRVAAPPVDGKANTAIIKWLRQQFAVSARIISGQSSCRKLVRIG